MRAIRDPASTFGGWCRKNELDSVLVVGKCKSPDTYLAALTFLMLPQELGIPVTLAYSRSNIQLSQGLRSKINRAV